METTCARRRRAVSRCCERSSPRPRAPAPPCSSYLDRVLAAPHSPSIPPLMHTRSAQVGVVQHGLLRVHRLQRHSPHAWHAHHEGARAAAAATSGGARQESGRTWSWPRRRRERTPLRPHGPPPASTPQIKSTTLDAWTPAWVDLMARVGNVRFNAVYEAGLSECVGWVDRGEATRPACVREAGVRRRDGKEGGDEAGVRAEGGAAVGGMKGGGAACRLCVFCQELTVLSLRASYAVVGGRRPLL